MTIGEHEHDLIRATSSGVVPVVAMCRACGERFMRRDGEWTSIEPTKAKTPPDPEGPGGGGFSPERSG